MLAVVAAASISGILLGWIRSLRATMIGALVISAVIACLIAVFHSRSDMAEGVVLSTIASFMFSMVISTAFALLTRRILLRASVASPTSTL